MYHFILVMLMMIHYNAIKSIPLYMHNDSRYWSFTTPNEYFGLCLGGVRAVDQPQPLACTKGMLAGSRMG